MAAGQKHFISCPGAGARVPALASQRVARGSGFLVVIQTEDAKPALGHYSSHSLLRINSNRSRNVPMEEKPEVEEVLRPPASAEAPKYMD